MNAKIRNNKAALVGNALFSLENGPTVVWRGECGVLRCCDRLLQGTLMPNELVLFEIVMMTYVLSVGVCAVLPKYQFAQASITILKVPFGTSSAVL